MDETARHPWSETWRSHVVQALKSRSFDSIIAFLRANEGKSYAQLTKQLDGVPQIQLISLAYNEGRQRNEVRFVALDGLCRNIVEKCDSGWRRGEKADWNQIRALSSWVSEVTTTGGNPELKDLVESIAEKLRSDLSIESNWVPQNNRDERLTKLFDEYWAYSTKSIEQRAT